MARVPQIIPVSDLRQDVADVLRAREPVVITQRGRAAAVMLSVNQYERGEEERQILKALVRGEREIEAGKGYDLDSVLAEAEALLASDDT
jgi:prevent-host-death family protein